MTGMEDDGVVLTQTRKSLGMTQEQLAAALGVGWLTISRMERGLSPVNVRTQLAVSLLVERKAREGRDG